MPRIAPQKRAYHMRARAEAAEQTVSRIHAAAVELFRSRPFAEVTLQAVADASGVTLQTILRRFGSKENLFTAAAEAYSKSVSESRKVEAGAVVSAIIGTLVASYEEMGDLNWRGVSQEDQFPLVKHVFDGARVQHREWIERHFADVLGRSCGDERERRILLLFAATDFYIWKLYRKDLGMSRGLTLARMTDLVSTLMREFRRRA